MTIRSVELYHVAVPLRTRVKHASHDRILSDNLVVRVRLDDGQEGYGEGVPRPYVTGETIETAFAALSGFDVSRQIGRPGDFGGLVRQARGMELDETRNDPRGMFGNAARCALELAILDAYGRRFGRSVGEAVRMCGEEGVSFEARPRWVRYSGAITAETPYREFVSALKTWLNAFHQVKVKVGVGGQDDAERLRRIRRMVGRRIDMRIDANEAWASGELVDRVRPLLGYRPSVLEQPVKHAEVGYLADLRGKLGLPVMLDESLCGYPDAADAVENGTADFLNVRLSKCGGIFPSLKIMGLAFRSGLGVQMGCHPGETGLLSAAGRHLAGNVQGIRYREGSYDRHILRSNIIKQDITFGYAGLAPPIEGPGLGVTVNVSALESITVSRKEIHHG